MFAIGRAIAFGKRAAVLTVVGNSLGALVLAALVSIGVGPLVQSSSGLRALVQVCGAGFLVYLGIAAWRSRVEHSQGSITQSVQHSAALLVREGFTVGVLNPKTAVFFATVMPRFLPSQSAGAGWQLFVMGAVFVGMAFISDSGYGLLAGQLRSLFDSHPRALMQLTGTGGVLITTLGVVLAVSTIAPLWH